MASDVHFLVLRFQSAETPLGSPDPSDFVYETHGTIASLNEFEEETVVGKFRLYYADVDSAMDEGFDTFEVLDSFSQTSEYHDMLYGSDGAELSERLLRELNDDVLGSNSLVIDRLEILPQYRRQCLGLIIMRRLIQRFSSGAGVIAIKPFPLQFEQDPSSGEEEQWRKALELSTFSRNEGDATRKLQEYYARLGFARMEGTPFMVRSTAFRLPTIEALCGD